MISDTLSALSTYLNDAYVALSCKHAVLPEHKTVRNLSASIDSLSVVVYDVPLGVVSDIRFSIINNVLNVRWKDPDDLYNEGVIVSLFGGTRLLMKNGSYPENEDDGTTLIDSRIKNAYNMTTLTVLLPEYEEETAYYFRFFSYTTRGTFNNDVQYASLNRFSSESYSWDLLVEHLHDYQKLHSLLPHPGDVVNLQYMLSDYCYDNGSKVMLNTRQLVYDHRDLISTVSVPWMILGFNANVPLYVLYRRIVDDQYESIFIQSVDDRLSSVSCYDVNGQLSTIQIEVGDAFLRAIDVSCRTYTETWDLTANVHSYSDTGNVILSISQNNFSYLNQGIGVNNAYSVPLSIVVDNIEYEFCGYTMTMQPVECLNGYSTSHYTTLQFDTPERLTAYLFEKYPNVATDAQYFFLSSDGFHEINWTEERLFSQTIYLKSNCDIYLKSGNKMKQMTQKFFKDRAYFSLSSDGTTKVPFIEAPEFKIKTAYLAANVFKNYGSIKTFFNNVPNDYVRYNGKTYKCIKNVANTTATDITTLNPETLTAYFQEDNSLSVQGRTYSEGDLISNDSTYGYRGTEMNSYGCNIYSESFFRQYCNNTNGSNDASYSELSKFDIKSTVNMANVNGTLLKLFNELEFIKHIKKSANLNVVSPMNSGYRRCSLQGSTLYECVCDLFWPLSYYEIFGTGAEGTSTFHEAYPDALSRIKHYMTLAGGVGSAANWWLRYPFTGYANSEYHVSTSGSATYTIAYNSYGFSPACLIT